MSGKSGFTWWAVRVVYGGIHQLLTYFKIIVNHCHSSIVCCGHSSARSLDPQASLGGPCIRIQPDSDNGSPAGLRKKDKVKSEWLYKREQPPPFPRLLDANLNGNCGNLPLSLMRWVLSSDWIILNNRIILFCGFCLSFGLPPLPSDQQDQYLLY